GERLRQNVLSALVGERSLLSEAGAERGDDPRIDLGEPLIAEAHALHHAGAKIVHDDIGPAHEVVNDRLAVLLAQIEGDRSLVAVEAAENRIVEAVRIVGDRGTRKIARAGALDLDDVGAVIGQHLGGARSEHHLGEVDDAHAGQRLRGGSLHDPRSYSAAMVICAFAAGRSPGSAPCARKRACSLATSILSTATCASSASAAATPAASPIAMHGGISRELRCADGVAE